MARPALQNESIPLAGTPITPQNHLAPASPIDISEARKEFSSIFADAFEASSSDIGGSSSLSTTKHYDVSEGQVYDPVLNGEAPTAEDMKLRIARFLNQGGDISKLLGTSEVESHDKLRERWIHTDPAGGVKRFCPAPYKNFTALGYLTPVEFNTVINLTRWQVMRNELLLDWNWLFNNCNTRTIKLNDDMTIKIPESGEYPGIWYSNYQDARSKVQSFLKLENSYVREMWRLYTLTGIEKLKYHVVQTTPIIQKLLWRFHTSDSMPWLNLRKSYGKMVHAETESDTKGTTDLGPIGSPFLFPKTKKSLNEENKAEESETIA